jgi:hypothetical protein
MMMRLRFGAKLFIGMFGISRVDDLAFSQS